jgi:CubicO group peptidase (beta-lactamase class C family)
VTDHLVKPTVAPADGVAPGGEGVDGVDVELPDGRRVSGVVEAGFGGVLDAFLDNFDRRRDLGAACAVVARGRTVVDLWGGIADVRDGRAWARATAAVIFSCSKGLVAMCAYRLVDSGRLDLDAPIARYWPEFANRGKAAITVRDAMSHRAGLAALDPDLTRDDVIAWEPVIEAIERQLPSDRPGDGHQYHTMTYGWIVGEVVRRVTGLRPGAFFRAEIGDPRGLEAWIGLPESPRPDVAWMEPPLPDEDSEAAREVARVAAAVPAIERAATMSGAFAFPADDRHVTFNDPDLQAAEIPGANGISTAMSLARLYAACLPSDPEPVISPASLNDALVVRSEGRQLTGLPDDGARWGTGFQLASPPSQPMVGASSFGHAGAGGQLAFGDVDHDLGFAYLGNQMGGYGDGRAAALTAALRAAIGA